MKPTIPMPDKQGCEDDPMYGVCPVDYYTAETVQRLINEAYEAGMADALAEFKEAAERLAKWQQEGEAAFEKAGRYSAMFVLGAWWADRPWRTRTSPEQP